MSSFSTTFNETLHARDVHVTVPTINSCFLFGFLAHVARNPTKKQETGKVKNLITFWA